MNDLPLNFLSNFQFLGYTSFESVYRPGYFIRHKNRRLQLSQLFSQSDRNDASFLMSDAYSTMGIDLSTTVETTEEWRGFLGKNIQVESKALPNNYWALDENRRNEGVLMANGHVFRIVEGLWGDGTVSFESTTMPGQYLCNRGGTIMVMWGDLNDEAFRRDCSFKVWENQFFDGYVFHRVDIVD